MLGIGSFVGLVSASCSFPSISHTGTNVNHTRTSGKPTTITNKESAPHNEAPKASEIHKPVSSSSSSTISTHDTGGSKTSNPSDKSVNNNTNSPEKSRGSKAVANGSSESKTTDQNPAKTPSNN